MAQLWEGVYAMGHSGCMAKCCPLSLFVCWNVDPAWKMVAPALGFLMRWCQISMFSCLFDFSSLYYEKTALHAACWLSISQCINFMVFRINKWSMPSLCATHFTAFVRTICFPINPISLCSPLGPLLEFPAECLLLNGCECCGRCLEYCPLDE